MQFGLREDPFVLPNVLTYLGMPEPSKWPCPPDRNHVLGVIRVARVFRARGLLKHLSNILEIPEEKFALGGKELSRLIRDKMRYKNRPYVDSG